MLKFPALRQAFNYDCGAVAAQSVIVYYGHDVSEERVMQVAGTTPRNGTPLLGMLRVLRRYALKCESRRMTLGELKHFIKSGVPVIVLLQAWATKKVNWESDWRDGHFAVAIGYDSKRLYFADPASITRSYLSFAELARRWHGREGKKKFVNWGIAVRGKRRVPKAERMG